MGSLIYQNEYSKEKASKERKKSYKGMAIYLIVLFAMVMLLHLVRIDPLMGDYSYLVYCAVIVVIILVSTWIIRKDTKPNQISIFEQGFVIRLGSKTMEFAFNEIEAMGYMEGYVEKPEHILYIMIIPKSEKPIMLNENLTSNFIEAASFLYKTYHEKHLLKDITKENIKDIRIRFGVKIVLEEGKFKDGKEEIPFKEIKEIKNAISRSKNGDYIGKIELKGDDEKGDRQTLLSIDVSEAINLKALEYIVYDL